MELALSLTIEGNGTIDRTPEPPCYHGDQATLTPIAEAGWLFLGWPGLNGGELADNDDGTWSVTMNDDRSVTAVSVSHKVFVPFVRR